MFTEQQEALPANKGAGRARAKGENAAPKAAASGADGGEPTPKPAEEASLSVVVITTVEELEARLADLDVLANAALEANPFFEHWMLIPAWRSLGKEFDLRVVLIYRSKGGESAPLLCGLFPLELRHKYRGFPLRVFMLWQHRFASLGTPLLHAEHARECLDTFFDWIGQRPNGARLMEFTEVRCDGPFFHVLNDVFNARLSSKFVSEAYARPLLRHRPEEDYLMAAKSGRHLRELRRKERRLAEGGKVEYSTLEAKGDGPAAIEEFLQLEASGWKGREGSAIKLREGGHDFFMAMGRGAFAKDRLILQSLRVAGKVIASKFNVVGGKGAYVLKIAFDEDYSRYSPGDLLELENMRWFQGNNKIEWVDSCARPSSHHFYRWLDRMMLQTVVIGSGHGIDDLFIAVLPLLQWGLRQWKHLKRRISTGAKEQ